MAPLAGPEKVQPADEAEMSTDVLPRWDLTPFFPSLLSPEFDAAFEKASQEIEQLAAFFDAHNIRRRESGGVEPTFVAVYEEATIRINALLQQLYSLSSYIGCFTSTDARDEEAKKADSLLDIEFVKLDPLMTRYTAWVGTTESDALIKQSDVARAHAYALRKSQYRAAHQMTEAEENLAAALRPASTAGWSQLHGNMSALLSVPVTLNGVEKVLPMSSVRALGNHPDRAVRKAGFEAEQTSWESVAIPFAAALNGIKGYQNVLRQKRGYKDDVEPTLLMNGIDRATLDAMQQACVESFPDFRRYMAAKARALGLEQLAWYDMNAPVGNDTKSWSWSDGKAFVIQNFGRYSARLADFASRAFVEGWLDVEPRVGKEGGAYCTGLAPGVSRVFQNYNRTFSDVSTLAHELGHAYHNLNLADRTVLQRETPMTLAETASIFCETICFDAALGEASDAERLALLNTSLERNLQVVVDIHSRFLFEQSVFGLRGKRNLTVAEFKSLMLDAQRATYGPDMSPLHPYMWAVKGHYYGPLFYNYPYTFGLLFGIGLYARYQEEPEPFKARYDDLLSSTGLADVATLGERFGVNVRDVAFWRSSLDVIRGQIDDFERLTAK